MTYFFRHLFLSPFGNFAFDCFFICSADFISPTPIQARCLETLYHIPLPCTIYLTNASPPIVHPPSDRLATT